MGDAGAQEPCSSAPRVTADALSFSHALGPLNPFLGGETRDRVKELPEPLIGVDDHDIGCAKVGFGIDGHRLAAGPDDHVQPLQGAKCNPVALAGLFGRNAKTVLQFRYGPRLQVLGEPALDGILLHNTFLVLGLC